MREHIERRTSVRVVMANLFVIAFCGAMFYYIYKLQNSIQNQRINVNTQSEAISLTNRFTQLVHQAQAEANLFAFTDNPEHLSQFGELNTAINQCADSLLLAMPGKDNEKRVREVEQLIMRKGQISYILSRQFYYYDPLSEINARLKAYTPPTPPTFLSNDSLAGKPTISADSTLRILSDLRILSEKASSEYRRRIKEYERKTVELITDDNHLSEEIAELLLDLNNEILESSILEMEISEDVINENLTASTYIAGAVLILIIVFVILILSDVNKGFRARKAAEKARAEAEEAQKKTEELMESRHKMLLTVSHDIKSPLASIIGNIELMDKTGNEKEVASIQQSAEHILNLLNNLLEFSSLEQGKLQIENSRFNVKQLCDETVSMFEPIALKKNLQFLVDNKIRENLQANSDPLKIKQIIGNLISNAIKYTIEGHISFGASLENGQLVFRISDSGIGIPSDKLEDIFKPFVRTDSGSRLSEGSGYGLSVVKGLVDLMEGTIEVQSEVGKGSRFTVRIPAETVVAESGANTTEQQDLHTPVDLVAQQHILVIDDDDTLLTVVSNMIEKLGHQVQICRSKNDIDEALHDTNSFDCVLTDREMGAISGNTILRLFKKADSAKPVYLMTARVDYDTEKAAQEGFDGFLPKPFKIKDLETMFGHASKDEGSNSGSESVFSDFPDLCDMLGDEEEAIRGVLTVFAHSTADNLVGLNECIERDDFATAHELCHKMLPMFIQLQQDEAVPFLTKMNELRGRDASAYPEWKDDAVRFMDSADKMIEMLSEKYGIG
ncbi:MAG: hybrid sensor histidine kinase/response regulator [Bacteroidales bacterium]|nr:hybrid sensor histidine kinase/response regulator [Bacteroidales bacterium]